MTFDQCHERLTAIRRKQGTASPLVRIDYGGAAYRGRLARSDSDPDRRRHTNSPFGVVVLAAEGLVPGPETFLQIGSIPPEGIRDISEN